LRYDIDTPLARPKVNNGTLEPAFSPEPEGAPPSDFEPLRLPPRDAFVADLPPTPLALFQAFIPVWLVQKWADYFEIAEDDPFARQVSVAKLYCFLAVLIYMGVHQENNMQAF
jgi:hypothetical protein